MYKKVNILNDTVPFIPDIYSNDNKYKQKDNIIPNNSINVDKVVFIVALSSDNMINISNILKYNDPNYMLYGVKAEKTEFEDELYYLPPINYFNINITQFSEQNYKVNSFSYGDSDRTGYDILETVGYDKNKIITVSSVNGNYTSQTYFYQDLTCYNFNRSISINIIFYFFLYPYNSPYPTDPQYPNIVNYNYFKNIIYYNNNYLNIFIYPYTIPFNDEIDQSGNVFFDLPVSQKKNTNITLFDTLNFSNLEVINFNEKIKFKYFETINSTPLNNLEIINYFSKNILSFDDFYLNNSNKDIDTIFISLNELSSISTENNLNVDKITSLETNYNKVNKSYINLPMRNSYSMNSKFSYINNKYFNNNKTYAQFNNSNNNDINTRICINYNINCYIDINVTLGANDYLPYLYAIPNNYLRQILLLINPQVCYNKYEYSLLLENLISNNNPIELVDYRLKIDSFSSLKFTNSYYIDRYKIIFIFSADKNDSSKKFCYYIYLNIAYYNSNNINIIDIYNTSDKSLGLSNINISYVNNNYKLSPSIFNSGNNINIYENIIDIDSSIIHYSYLIDYTKFVTNLNKNNINSVISSNIYFLLSNIVPRIFYNNNDTYYFISNIFDVPYKEINIFNSNIIQLNNSLFKIKYNNYYTNTIFNISLTIDDNISSKYINYYNYQNININIDLKYIDYRTNVKVYGILPYGYYKQFNYHTAFPLFNLDTQSESNDDLVTDGCKISTITSNNYSLLIKTYPFMEYDDLLFKLINENPDYYNFYLKYPNFNNIKTNFYIAMNNSFEQPYMLLNNVIPVINLFNNPTSESDKLFNFSKQFNLLINQYYNFFNMNFSTFLYNPQNINGTLIPDINNFNLNPHINKNISDILYYDNLRFNSTYVFEKIDIQLINDIQKINNLINNYKSCITDTITLNYLFTIFILIKKIFYFIEIMQITSLSYNQQNTKNFANINVPLYSDLRTLYNMISLNFIKIASIFYIQNTNINIILDTTYIESIYKLLLSNPINFESLIPLIIQFILYIEKSILNIIKKLRDIIIENKKIIDNFTTSFLLPNFNDFYDYIDKYINTYVLYKSLEENILSKKLIDNDNILVYKTAIYLYNINNIYNIIDFTIIFGNNIVEVNELNLIKFNYIFYPDYLIFLNNKYYSIIEKLEFLLYNIENYLVLPDSLRSIYSQFFEAGINNYIRQLLENLEILREELINSLILYENNEPFIISDTLLEDIINLNNLIFNFTISSSNIDEYYNMMYYYIFDLNFFINNYIFTIKELLISEYYKYEILSLSPNSDINSINFTSYNSILWNSYGDLIQSINLIINFFIKDIIKEDIKDYINNTKYNNIIQLKLSITNEYYKKNLYNIYDDHLQIITTNIPPYNDIEEKQIDFASYYGFNKLQIPKVTNNFSYYLPLEICKNHIKYKMYIRNEQIYGIISNYNQLITDFADFYKNIINTNIRNYLSYAYTKLETQYVNVT
jgi:hypothetical protein